ncbi:HD family phosphohydrolase [Enterococcus nangangensis]|uniref:HD family phosphohydrolase n=1 Tax=Enterococcus nangangensis TaxID=2559926 RepID=UPI0010F8AD66|nr:HDIG domain-containing metalloprotein [Enterococcus nangangensis]
MNTFIQKKPKVTLALMLSFFSIILFLLTFSNVRQKQLHLQEGQPAEETIRANKTIENTAETENKRQLAEEAVVSEYTYQPDYKDTQVGYVEKLFQLVDEVNSDFAKQTSSATTTDANSLVEAKVAALKGKFESVNENALAFYQGLPSVFYTEIFGFSTDDIHRVRDEATTIIEKYMEEKIRQTNLSETKQSALYDVQLTDLSSDLQQSVRYLINQGIIVNEFYNEKKTEEQKAAARDTVTPVMIYQGEIIVREGNQIDSKAMEKLELLGMTKQSTSIFPLLALAVLIAFQSVLLAYLIIDRSFSEKLRLISLFALVMIASVAVMKLFQLFYNEQTSFLPQIFPVAFAPLILTIFCNRRLGILGAVMQVLIAYFLYFDSVGTTFLQVLAAIYLFNGIMATMVQRKRLANQAGRAFVWIILFPFIFNVVMVIYQGLSFTETNTLLTVACGLLGSGFSYLLSVGLHPYLELILTDDSDLVLNELSNPNHPLLKELLETAPGTYHHSMMVANLSANAVAEIGGRALLTRVACYYHDIGKIKHPNFFVENLPNGAENPHNYLLPEDSKQIIFSHVTEGVKILEEYHMPQFIVDICWQHHGTTLMTFFYVKAKERNPKITEAEFRYPGPKPQTREAAVVNIADSCEAAVRAMGQPTPEKIQKFVHDLIQGRIADGQFNECDITLKDLVKVEKSIISGLGSTFHSRIQYPTLKKTEEEKA